MKLPDEMTIKEFFESPIAYYPSLTVFAGVTGAVMFSQALYWSKHTNDPDGWFYKTQKDWEMETGLTRREQETARKKLVKSKFLQEKLGGNPGRLYFRINWEAIDKFLISYREYETRKR